MTEKIKGYIYKISGWTFPYPAPPLQLSYYGSTTLSIRERLSDHESDYMRFKNHTSDKYTSSFEIFDRCARYRIECVEEVFCDITQLRKIETLWIINNECVNNVGKGTKSMRNAIPDVTRFVRKRKAKTLN